jgi:hypothetical protein
LMQIDRTTQDVMHNAEFQDRLSKRA